MLRCRSQEEAGGARAEGRAGSTERLQIPKQQNLGEDRGDAKGQ